MSDGLSDILEVEYGKAKEKKNTVDLSSLLEMVERVYETIGAEVVGEAKEGKDAVSTEKKETETINIALPFVQLSEAWGTPESLQRTDIAKFIDQLGATAGADPVATLRNRLAYLEKFTTVVLEGKGEKQPISQVISNILLLDTLAAIVTGAQYSASPAGFLFEAFLAALAGGDSAQISAAQSGRDEKTIADFTIILPGQTDGVPVSLKLLARKGGGVHGSVSDLLNSFANQGVKEVDPVAWEEATTLKKAWAGARQAQRPKSKLTREGSTKEPKAVWDDERQEFVSTQEPVPGEEEVPLPTAAGDEIVGMKYIIVLKTAGSEGVNLDFYEFDFTWEKFKLFQNQSGRIPEPGSGETQFKLTKTDYIDGPKGQAGMGAVKMAESFTLPSSNQVRLKAQVILKELYNDFYKILEALKTATDNLNTYLANPEDKPAGNTAASAANELEKDITKTTE